MIVIVKIYSMLLQYRYIRIKGILLLYGVYAEIGFCVIRVEVCPLLSVTRRFWTCPVGSRSMDWISTMLW